MVTFPSLAKMRLSELVVSFAPTTKGLPVVPSTNSTALDTHQRRFNRRV